MRLFLRLNDSECNNAIDALTIQINGIRDAFNRATGEQALVLHKDLTNAINARKKIMEYRDRLV